MMCVKKSIVGTLILVTGVCAGTVFLLPPQSRPAFMVSFISTMAGSSAHAATEQTDPAQEGSPKLTQKSESMNPEAPSSIQTDTRTTNRILVTTVHAQAQTQQPLLIGYGEVTARWTTELTAEVSGQIDHVSTKLLAGSLFNKGDVLARINAVDYESDLAAAKADLATAKVAYLEQQRETQQAKKRWKLSGLSGTPSALTLQTPQLAQALASKKSAEAALAKAQKNLARTEILAPFNGRVSSRNINPGGYVAAGTALAEVFSTDVIEINIPLTDQQFSLLGSEDEAINRAVTLKNTSHSSTDDTQDNTKEWTAKIARFQYHIDSTERTRNLVLEVSNNQAAEYLMPGTFVKAFIPGKSTDGLVKVPASSLSRDGYIWHVENDVLHRFKANIAYRKDDYIVLQGLDAAVKLQVVRYPQSAFLAGQAVNSQTVADKSNTPSDKHITNNQVNTRQEGTDA